jgi:hypothetical protein
MATYHPTMIHHPMIFEDGPWVALPSLLEQLGRDAVAMVLRVLLLGGAPPLHSSWNR